MTLSINQTITLIVVVLGLCALTALHDVDGNVTVPVLTAIAANALGYVNGKKNGRNEVVSEIGKHVDTAMGQTPPGAAAGEVPPATLPVAP